MSGKNCKLYDETLVRNIMISTGLSIVEYIKQFKSVDAIDICDFIDQNADSIIEDTIDDMNHEFPDDKNDAPSGEDEPLQEDGPLSGDPPF